MEAYLFLLATLFVVIIGVVICVVYSKVKPPYIRENDRNRDSISVFVYSHSSLRFRRYYREYVFVKRENGKYRMKCMTGDWITAVFSMFQLFLGVFIISLFKDEFIKNPDSIPALIGFFIWLIFICVIANSSLIEAIMFFRKTMNRLNE